MTHRRTFDQPHDFAVIGNTPAIPDAAAIENDPLSSLHAACPQQSLAVARLALGRVMELDPQEREMPLSTLRTWFQTRGRSAEAARLLYCHRNTVRNRLVRLEKLSGRSLEDPRGIAELLIAAETLLAAATAHQSLPLKEATPSCPSVERHNPMSLSRCRHAIPGRKLLPGPMRMPTGLLLTVWLRRSQATRIHRTEPAGPSGAP